MLHVLFTTYGIPGWIGFEPREGSEEMPATVKVGKADVACDVPFLAAYLRDPATGKWAKRPKPPAPTAEERQAALDRAAGQLVARGDFDAAAALYIEAKAWPTGPFTLPIKTSGMASVYCPSAAKTVASPVASQICSLMIVPFLSGMMGMKIARQ